MKTITVKTGDLLIIEQLHSKKQYTYLVSIETTDYGHEKITATQIDNPKNKIDVTFFKNSVVTPSSPSITAINSKDNE